MAKIEKNIPLPPAHVNRTYGLHEMEVGDSILLDQFADKKELSTPRARISGFAKSTGWKFRTSYVEGGLRVWRIA